MTFQLANALSGQTKLVAYRLERPRVTFEAEPELEDPSLPFGERVERAPYALAPERLLGLLERVCSLTVGEEVTELALIVRAHALIQ